MDAVQTIVLKRKVPKATVYEYIDPIYSNKDPIKVSLKMRLDEGSYTSFIPAYRSVNPNKTCFKLS